MKQLLQYYKDGALRIEDVPVPLVRPHEALIRTHYSFVSMGTERMKVTQARMSLLDKAKERPDQVRQVVQTVRDQGILATWRKVQERLKTPTTLGYSLSGTVVQVGSAIDDLAVGDRVACVGEGIATHAEYNAIPRTLVVPVPEAVGLEAAASATIGAIAIQGIRQARLELGESVAIVGLGMLGQFLVQLCRANGCRVIGIDIDRAKCDLALTGGAQAAAGAAPEEALPAALRLSGGRGMDAVFLTVSTSSTEPIELAASLVREKGRVVCLGNTRIDLAWRDWFAKEIDFLFSRAMGAGMFDTEYLAGRRDYPVGYVRWSAGRNMEAVLDLLAQGKLTMDPFITHRFTFSEAETVFDRIANDTLPGAVGIVFRYPEAESGTPPILERTHRRPRAHEAGAVRLGLIGAGNYTKSMLLPSLAKLKGLTLEAVCTTKGMNAEAIAKRYGIPVATTDASEVLASDATNAVLIATRHNSHARFAAEALRAGKHVYVEKPLALSEEELTPIVEALIARKNGPTLWVGHNRRFSPLSSKLRAHFRGIHVRQVRCEVHSAPVPPESWYQDPGEGGGMLFGDACHFIDLALWFAESAPEEVDALATDDPSHREEAWAIQIRFANGGLAQVQYVCGNQDGYPREAVDVWGGGRSGRIEDFRRLTLRTGRRSTRTRLPLPDPGQRAMLEAAFEQFRGTPGATDYTESFILSAQVLLAAARSIRERRRVRIAPVFPFSIS